MDYRKFYRTLTVFKTVLSFAVVGFVIIKL